MDKYKIKKEYVFTENASEFYKRGRHDGYEYMCTDIAMILSIFNDKDRLRKELIKYLKKVNPLAVEFYLSEDIELSSDNLEYHEKKNSKTNK